MEARGAGVSKGKKDRGDWTFLNGVASYGHRSDPIKPKRDKDKDDKGKDEKGGDR